MPMIGKVEPYIQLKRSETRATQTERPTICSQLNELITLDVGGQIFRTRRSTLSQLPGTLLSELTLDHSAYDRDSGHYYFDRNPVLFQFILDAYRKGKTHFPHDHCHKLVREELLYWGLSETALDCCCFIKLRESEVRERTMLNVAKKLRQDFASTFVDLDNPSETKWRKWQLKTWYFLEDPNSSRSAKVWAVLFLVIVVLQLTNQSLQTHPVFRKDNKFNRTYATNLTNNAKLIMYYTTDSATYLSVMDEICVAIFMLEWSLRLLVCPKKKMFVKSFYNIIDCLAILPLLVEVSISRYVEESDISIDFLTKILFILSVMGIFRVVRLFKFGRHFVPVKIMFMSLGASLREIIFLFVILSTGMLIFATLIYWAEFYSDGHFDSIPTGLWWSLITMSTVGYGDLYPTNPWGYFVGALCAVVGMLITGLPIPIIANNFTNFYNYATIHQATVKSKKFIKVKRRVNNKLALMFPKKTNDKENGTSDQATSLDIPQVDTTSSPQ